MAEPSGANKREFSRSHTHVETTVSQGSAAVKGALRDVSMNGLFVTCDSSVFTAGAECNVDVVLSEEVHVSVKGHIVRCEKTGLAIVVEEIPVESYRHLQQLVLYNADDPDRVEQELSEHIGIRRIQTLPPGRGHTVPPKGTT